MKITITTKPINNGKKHVLSIPFMGTFTVDQKDRNKALVIDSLQRAIKARESAIAKATNA